MENTFGDLIKPDPVDNVGNNYAANTANSVMQEDVYAKKDTNTQSSTEISGFEDFTVTQADLTPGKNYGESDRFTTKDLVEKARENEPQSFADIAIEQAELIPGKNYEESDRFTTKDLVEKARENEPQSFADITFTQTELTPGKNYQESDRFTTKDAVKKAKQQGHKIEARPEELYIPPLEY